MDQNERTNKMRATEWANEKCASHWVSKREASEQANELTSKQAYERTSHFRNEGTN